MRFLDGERQIGLTRIADFRTMLMTYEFSFCIAHLDLKALMGIQRTACANSHVYHSLTVAELRRADKGLPWIYPVVACDDEFHGAVDACPWIPATALLDILQVYLQQIVARLHQWSDVYAESIVAIGPISSLLTVQIDSRLGHRTVEYEFSVLAACRNLDIPLIVPLADPWQCS